MSDIITQDREARARGRTFWRQTTAGLVVSFIVIAGAVFYGINNPPEQHGASQAARVAAPVGSDDNDTIVLRAASDGAETTIVIPNKPVGKATDPEGIYDTIAPMAFSLESQGVKDLVDGTVGNGSTSDFFQRIMTKGAAGDGLGIAADEGALVMAVWYKRERPDLSLHDAALALAKDLPDVETFKTAVVVASNMLADVGKRNSTDSISTGDNIPASNAPQGAVTRDAPAPVSYATNNANAPTRAVRAPDTSGCPESHADNARRMKLLEESNAGKRKLTEAEYEDAMTIPCVTYGSSDVDNAR